MAAFLLGVIDYGMGNTGSILNMIRFVGGEVALISEADELKECKGIVLPGVGAFDKAVQKLQSGGFIEALGQARIQGLPILGICLGMQLMTRHSEEGDSAGLGWFAADTVRFPAGSLRVPHVGWNQAHFCSGNPLSKDMDGARFYFLHSFFVQCDESDSKEILCRSDYGREFVSGLQCGRVWGVQFHPEKSHKFGKLLFRNFLEQSRLA